MRAMIVSAVVTLLFLPAICDGIANENKSELPGALGIQEIRTLRSSGLGPNGVDVVVVSAGFTDKEKDEFFDLCEKMKKSLFSFEPWGRYSPLISFHAVFVADESREKSRLGVRGYEGQILGCDNGRAVEYASYAAEPDGVVVLHNSSFSTASCGTWGVATVNRTSAENASAVVHELGHGMSGVGDEYIQRGDTFTGTPESLYHTVNVSAVANPRLCRWNYWTVDLWPGSLRPQAGIGSVVRNFEGAGWPKGIYRPESTCIMRGCRDSFCVVCNEAVEANFFRNCEMFSRVEPAEDELVLWKGESLDFHVRAMDFICNPPEWLVSRLEFFCDGQKVAVSDRGDLSFRLDSSRVEPGFHQLGVLLNVQCDNIRRDFSFLSANKGWRVNVMSDNRPAVPAERHDEPVAQGDKGDCGPIHIEAPETICAVTGKKTVINLKAQVTNDVRVIFEPVELPAGASVERDSGTLAWTPPPGQIGTHKLRILLRAGSSEREIKIEGRVRGDAKPTPVSYVNQYIPNTINKLKALESSPLVYRRIFETTRLLRDRYPQVYGVALVEAQKMYEQLEQPYRRTCLEDLALHAWAFTGKPEILAWLRQISGDQNLDQARVLAGKLDVIDAVANIKTIEIDGDLSKLPSLAAMLIQETDSMKLAAYEMAVAAVCRRIEDKQACQKTLFNELMNGKKGPGRGALVRLVPLDKTPVLMEGLAALSQDGDPLVAQMATLTQDYFSGLGAKGAFIDAWMISGPYRSLPNGSIFDDAFAPEKNGESAEWKPCDLKSDGNGSYIVQLDKMFGGNMCAAYMKTIIHSAYDQKARFKAGSDDGIKVWLNGKLVHQVNAQRGVNPEDDTFYGELKKGDNVLLCKVVQYQLGWGACMRIFSSEGGCALGVQVLPVNPDNH